MAYDAKLVDDPAEDLCAAVGEFCIAWGQVERVILLIVKRLNGWSLARVREWGKDNQSLDKRLREVRRGLAGSAIPTEHDATIRGALAWIKAKQGDRNKLVHGALILSRQGVPVFNFQGRETSPDAAKYRRLAAEAQALAQHLDNARW